MRVAIVADWLVTAGGAEQTIAQFLTIWPDATVFTTVAKPGLAEQLGAKQVRVSRLQGLYRLLGRHQPLLPFLPRAIESLDLRGFDLIFSSSHAVGKGVIPPSTAAHVCYCHTPMRYAWEMEAEYLRDFRVPGVLRRPIRRILGRIRRWDLSTAKRVDAFIANSAETQSRIERIYGRDATVIHPPVDDRFFQSPLVPMTEREAYVAVGRLVPYKRFDVLIDAANARGLPLLIAGSGQEERRLRAMAGPTVRFLGFVPDEELPMLYGRAKAVLFAPHEDAGIVPLEAQACGTPVIAYGAGGVRDTVIDGKTGVFFAVQEREAVLDAIARFDEMRFDPEALRAHAKKFSAERFRREVEDIVMKSIR